MSSGLSSTHIRPIRAAAPKRQCQTVERLLQEPGLVLDCVHPIRIGGLPVPGDGMGGGTPGQQRARFSACRHGPVVEADGALPLAIGREQVADPGGLPPAWSRPAGPSPRHHR
jgi:hypothetical protein